MDLFDIAAKISLNTKDYEKALAGADKQGASFAEKLKKGLGTAAKVGGAAIAAIGTEAVALGTKFVNGMRDVATYGDEVDKMSQKLGLSKTAYQEWDYVLGQAGVDITSMSTGLKTLTNKLDEAKNGSEDAQKMFAALGLSMEDLSTMSREDVFASVITGFQGMADSTERAALANDLFGRSGQELTPLFNSSIEETNELRKAAHDLGFVLSDEAVTASADFNDALDTLKRTIKGIKNQFLQNFLPAATKVMDGLTAIFGGDSSSGVGMIKEGVQEIVDSLSSKIPEFLEIGWGIVEAIVQAISENLPTLVERGSDIILNGILPGLLENVPVLLDAVFQTVSQIVLAIGQALPELIPVVVSAIMQLAQVILENIPLLLDAVLQVIEGLSQGILDAIPIIIDALPEVITAIVDFILGSIPQIIETGVELFVSLVEKLPYIIDKIVEAIPKIIKGILSALTKSIPQIVRAGIELLVSLIKNLPQIITTIVDAIPEIIGEILNALSDSIPELVMMGVELFVALIENLPTIIIEIVKAVPQIIEGIVKSFGSLMYKMVEVGANLLKGIWEGIKSTANWLWDKVSGWASNLFGKIKGFFGIHSPSTEMAWVGEMLAKGLAGGIEDYGDEAIDAAESMSGDIMDAMSGLSGSAKFSVGYKSDRMARAFGSNAFNPAAALAGGVPINLYIDGDKWVGSTDSRMDRNLGQIQKIKARYGGA